MSDTIHYALMDLECKVVARRNRGEAVGPVDVEFVLCEDDRTVMLYAHINENEAELASFMLPAGAVFDPAAYALIIGTQSRTVH